MVWKKGDCPHCGKKLDKNKLRIEIRYRKCEFNIYHAIMDACLGNYAHVILNLLEEDSQNQNRKIE